MMAGWARAFATRDYQSRARNASPIEPAVLLPSMFPNRASCFAKRAACPTNCSRGATGLLASSAGSQAPIHFRVCSCSCSCALARSDRAARGRNGLASANRVGAGLKRSKGFASACAMPARRAVTGACVCILRWFSGGFPFIQRPVGRPRWSWGSTAAARVHSPRAERGAWRAAPVRPKRDIPLSLPIGPTAGQAPLPALLG